ncbi:MAG: outer membrane beta-barrel protein [Candidatus Marinimicrobia bacterium]|nr:outer membrane beta-barrel protein [Candidatus Neomarinimicrobiota bacterium]MCF7922273.1 outer membrane beta-barrel protein [Candidatus Neomarinimicrobiota bacterium]
MKKLMTLLIAFALMGMLTLSYGQTSYSTSRISGTIMISGSGTYQTDLSQDLRSSLWGINTDLALFLFPQFAAGIDLGYGKSMNQLGDPDDPDVFEVVTMSLGPRVYFFMGGKYSELTPFIKGGANYLVNKTLYNDEEQNRDESELGLVASVGLLLNLAKNVGLTVEAEYNFEKGTDVNDIDTKQLLVKFGIRSFLGE